jgi:hypothetical protein
MLALPRPAIAHGGVTRIMYKSRHTFWVETYSKTHKVGHTVSRSSAIIGQIFMRPIKSYLYTHDSPLLTWPSICLVFCPLAQFVYRRATGWTAGVRFPTGAEHFSPLHGVETRSGAHPASYPRGTLGTLPGMWNWPLTSICCRGQGWWSCIAPSIRLRGVVINSLGAATALPFTILLFVLLFCTYFNIAILATRKYHRFFVLSCTNENPFTHLQIPCVCWTPSLIFLCYLSIDRLKFVTQKYLFDIYDIVYSHSIGMSWKENTVKCFERLAWKTIYRVIYLTTFPLAQIL